jgi:protein phosphatase
MQRLVEAGELTQEEAERSERRNIILQALGPEPTVRIDLTHQQLRQNDILVLCTDGLSGLVKKEEIAEVVTGTDDLVEACRQLIDRANENGGPDNITAIVAKMEGTGLQASGSADKVGHAVYALPGSTPQGGIPREEAPTAPTFRRASPAPLPNSATSAAQNVTDERPIQTSSGAMDTRRAVITALAATLALLGLFLLARQLRGTGPHAATAPSTVDTTDTAARTKKP